MVICSECGAQQTDTARFCQQCGASLAQDLSNGQKREKRNHRQGGQSSEPPQQGQPRQRHGGGGTSPPPAGGQSPQGQAGNAARQGPTSAYEEGFRDAGFGMVPPGIRILCIVMGVLGGFLLLAGGISNDVGTVASQAGASDAGSMLGNVGALFMLIGVGSFGGIYGLWNRRTWGWVLTVGLFGIGALLSLSLLGGTGQGIGLVLLIVQGTIVGYLFTKREMYDVDRYLS